MLLHVTKYAFTRQCEACEFARSKAVSNNAMFWAITAKKYPIIDFIDFSSINVGFF